MTGFSRTGPAPLSLGRRLRWVGLAVVAAVALAACEDPTERAERHYQSAVSLIAEGKVELALVELRRVFDYDGRHREARLLYASTQMERGQTQEAYSQYLRLIEQFPNTLVARLALAETAFDTGNWDEFSRHGGAVITLATAPTPQSTTDPAEGSAGSAAPDLDTAGGDTANGGASDELAADAGASDASTADAGEETDTPAPDLSAPLVLDPALDPDTADAVAAIAAALAYRSAVDANDVAGQGAAADDARRVLDRAPDNTVARRVVIAHMLTGTAPLDALPEIDRVLARTPDVLDLHLARLRLLSQADMTDAVGAQLQRMAELFPDDVRVRDELLRWYRAQGDIDGAEAYLREIAASATATTTEAEMLVLFLHETRGTEAALRELETLIEATETPDEAQKYRGMAAALRFDSGARAAGIAELRALLDGATPSDQTRGLQIDLARMLLAEGDRTGAEPLITAVLTEDRTNVEALKLRAAWAIADDRSEEAIADLRTALGQTPRDPELLTLMASAHAREGSRDLAGDRLALAVETSGVSVSEAMRYAQFLLSEGRLAAARKTLSDALTRAPDNLAIIGLLGEIALSTETLAEVRALVARLTQIATPEALDLATSLNTAAMIRENRIREAVTLLEAQVASGGSAAQREIVLLILLLARDGDLEAARATLAAALESTPNDMSLRMLDAVLHIAEEDIDAAERKLREIVASRPGAEAPVRELYRLLMRQGRSTDAVALVQAELVRAPNSRFLRLVNGAQMSESGDIDGAIRVFESLYEEDTNDAIIANNLASLLSAHRGADPDALERAYAIARRLRGLEVPAFQDTYGWIAFQRGDLQEAVRHLEPAAAGLPEDPLVQFHLARTYLALDRGAEARAQLEKTLKLAGDNPLPQFDLARSLLAELDTAEDETQ